jgi:hypothetical protein
VPADSQPLAVGDEAIVEKVDGLTLTVRKADPVQAPNRDSL